MTYVNSTALGLLVKASDDLAARGGGLATVNAPDRVAIVIERS